MRDAILETLWRVIECRDQSLNNAHRLVGQQLSQLCEKEDEIRKAANALTEKEHAIVTLASSSLNREAEIMKKEEEIRRLAGVASERLELINQQYSELEAIRGSSEYRFGCLALNPCAGSEEAAPWQHTLSMNDTAAAGLGREQNIRDCRPFVLWFTGLSASGKTTLAGLLQAELAKSGLRCFVLDGDGLRSGLCSDLGFSPEDRAENLRRAGEVARLLVDAGLVVIAAFISPYLADRARVRSRFDKNQFYEIYLECPIEVCRQRDPKGLYRKAQQGLIPKFTGVSDPYEPPPAPDLVVRTGELTVYQSLQALSRFSLDRCLAKESSQ